METSKFSARLKPRAKSTVDTGVDAAPPSSEHDQAQLEHAMKLLAQNGYEVSPPKKRYVKHSYEIEEELFERFHSMIPVLGFPTVKAAINDAIRWWCGIYEKDYKNKSGNA